MTVEQASYRRILTSSSIVGGASMIGILLAVLRMKVAALALGPAGIGLVSLLQAAIATIGAIAGLGIANAATRQIAAGRGGPGEAVARRVLFWSTAGLALTGAYVVSIAGGAIIGQLIPGEFAPSQIAWIALGVALTLVAAAQTGLLTGLGQIKAVAKTNVAAGILATVAVVVTIWWLRDAAIWVLVLSGPATAALAGAYYALRAPRALAPRQPWSIHVTEAGVMVRLGLAMMLAGLISSGGLLAVRALVGDRLGLESIGLFQAAWAISTTYLGFILAAMTTDYYPRLSATIDDHGAANRLVNQQTEIALLFGGPVIVAMIAAAPLLIHLLYAAKFTPAADILRWQLIGDILKIVSWPLAYVALASKRGAWFVACEFLGMASFLLCVMLLVPQFGVAATGIGYLGMYLPYLPLVYFFARRLTGFRWSGAVKTDLTHLLLVALATLAAAEWSLAGGLIVGAAGAALLGAKGYRRVFR